MIGLDIPGYTPGALPWTLEGKVRDFLKPDSRLLLLAPGEGETLSAQVYESGGEGARVQISPTAALPFPDGAFDLLVCRERTPGLDEVKRLLALWGVVFFERRGGRDGLELLRWLFPGEDIPEAPDNLETREAQWRGAGLRIMYRNQAFPMGHFDRPEALKAWLSSRRPESAPDEERLSTFCREMEAGKPLPVLEHRYLLIGQKRRRLQDFIID